ncbi:hypothetical protein V8C86DRAFT_1518286 [Haematococcus lacustris]
MPMVPFMHSCEMASSMNTMICFVVFVQAVQAPLQPSTGSEWKPSGYRALSLRVYQVGEEKEFQAAVMEDGCAVTVVGDAIMPSDQELWALLTLAMHHANVIFKQFATLPDGSMHIVKRKNGKVSVCSKDADATSYCNNSYVHNLYIDMITMAPYHMITMPPNMTCTQLRYACCLCAGGHHRLWNRAAQAASLHQPSAGRPHS